MNRILFAFLGAVVVSCANPVYGGYVDHSSTDVVATSGAATVLLANGQVWQIEASGEHVLLEEELWPPIPSSRIRFWVGGRGQVNWLIEKNGDVWTLDNGANTWINRGPIPGTPAAIPSLGAVSQGIDTIRPNPFNPSATIDFSIPHRGRLVLVVYDAAGRFVRTLIDGQVEAGKRSITWDGRDNAGKILANGTYFYQLTLDSQVLDKGKAVILK